MPTKRRRISKGINQRTGKLKKGYRYDGNGRVVKAKTLTKSTARKRKSSVGINKTTGRLKKGFRYNERGQVVKAKKKK
jgi:hypothetical protein